MSSLTGLDSFGDYAWPAEFSSDEEESLEAEENEGVHRATDEQIASIEVIELEESDIEDKEECSICIIEYEIGSKIKVIPCNHRFHSSCLDRWLLTNAICPKCRRPVFSKSS